MQTDIHRESRNDSVTPLLTDCGGMMAGAASLYLPPHALFSRSLLIEYVPSNHPHPHTSDSCSGLRQREFGCVPGIRIPIVPSLTTTKIGSSFEPIIQARAELTPKSWHLMTTLKKICKAAVLVFIRCDCLELKAATGSGKLESNCRLLHGRHTE